jgi:hypothetical protein
MQDISENGADPVHLTAIHRAAIIGGGEPSPRNRFLTLTFKNAYSLFTTDIAERDELCTVYSSSQ